MKILLILICFLSSFSLYADSYHYYNSLFGDRAAGMGGAYSAIADSPSGIYYNPAGTSLAPDNYLTVSSNMYTEVSKRYQNVFGRGEDYVRKSKSFNPNFIGTIKKISKFSIGIAIINPVNEKFDQADQFNLPPYFPDFTRSFVDYTEENQNLQAGLSLAYPLSRKLQIGMTAFYFDDSSKIVLEQIVEKKDRSFIKATYRERRNTTGLIPVLGVLYDFTEKLSLGATIRKPKVLKNSQIISGDRISDKTKTVENLIYNYNTTVLSSTTQNEKVYMSGGLPVSIPEIFEYRVGLAYFLSSSFIMSADLIQYDSFRKNRNRSEWEPFSGELTMRDRRDPELDREKVLNYAFGFEYFLLPTVSLRIGTYSNNANTSSYNWKRAVGEFILANQQKNYIDLGNNTVYYPEILQRKTRYENVDLRGYTIGISFESNISALSLTYVYEYGKGASQISASQLPQSLIYANKSIYIIASSHK